MFCSLKCKVRIDGRRKKRNGELHQVESEDAFGGKLNGRGVIRTTTRTCLEVAHIRPVVAGSCVTLGVKLDLRHKLFSDKLPFGFDHFTVDDML